MTLHNSTLGDDGITLKGLAALEPLCALSVASRQRLAAICRLDRARARTDVFSLADWAGRVVYLLTGELRVDYRDRLVMVLVGGSGRALSPVWQTRPQKPGGHPAGAGSADRPLAARAITDCSLLSMDEESFDRVATWDQMTEPHLARAAGAAVETTGTSFGDGEPGSGRATLADIVAGKSLVMNAFAHIPPVNIPLLLQSFERMEVRRGMPVVRQGEAGDFYYLIERGRCRVTRDIAGATTEVAELRDADGFGEEALVADAQRNATVTMKTDGILWRLAKADFVKLLQQPLLRKISAAEARSPGCADHAWIDIRFPVEFRQNGVPGAINIPLNEIRHASGVLDPARDYIIYCQSGRRSSAAAFLLAQRGVRAHWLAGGLNAMNEHQEPVA